ncbi:MAG: malate/lactate/ureidoglycolate dehydrogenase [Deltaproteobacteria bacterium]|nr:malate/lactate/ureidoglycolate dehydrogenase [Deltaproteobacteria bacterium]
MLIIREQNLFNLAKEIIQRAGSESREAGQVAGHLVRSNLLGHDSHGVGMIPLYLKHISQGLLIPNRPARLLKENGSIMVFDGQRGYGQRTAAEAMEAAIAKCKETGLSLMALRNAHHIGRVGAYGEQSIEAGLVSVHFVNVVDHPPVVTPYGGRDARFNTNPVCIALPGTENTPPILLDMATSKIPVGKARVAMDQGTKLPLDLILDPEGNPTDDPRVIFSEPRGSLRVFGLHKGYGIAFFCELLAGVLGGGGTIHPGNERLGSVMNNMLVFVLDPARLVDSGWMQREVDALVSYVKESPPEDPTTPVMVAGDPERKNLAERREKGIPMPPAAWQELVQAAESVGVPRDHMESPIT